MKNLLCLAVLAVALPISSFANDDLQIKSVRDGYVNVTISNGAAKELFNNLTEARKEKIGGQTFRTGKNIACSRFMTEDKTDAFQCTFNVNRSGKSTPSLMEDMPQSDEPAVAR